MEIILRQMTGADWPDVAEIYKQGIDTGNATFQKEIPTAEDWDKGHIPTCRIVAVADDKVVGWAALTQVSGRCVYAGVAEVSVYIANEARGQQVGSKLLAALIAQSESNNFWTLQAGIFPENTASLHLHKKFGFREVGYRERVGKMDDTWRDTVLLERRSKVVGVD